jgi:hypothetical protein
MEVVGIKNMELRLLRYFLTVAKEQSFTKAAEMKPGHCINIPAEVKHWHGAAPDEWFSHLAIEVPGEEISNEWCEPVAYEIYKLLR